MRTCKDCPLYSSKRLLNSTNLVKVHENAPEISSQQEYKPVPAVAMARYGTCPRVEISIPSELQLSDVSDALTDCYGQTQDMSAREKLRYFGRLILGNARDECPAFNQLQNIDEDRQRAQ